MDIDDAVNYLTTMGYSKIDSLNAFIKAQYDIQLSIQYLINVKLKFILL